MTLLDARLPSPQTFALESEATLSEALGRLGTAVVKPVYTSKGRGMVRLDGDGATNALDPAALVEGPLLLQRFIASPGRDIGACVLGGRFVGAFYRVAGEGEWITSTSAGGRYEPCQLPRRAIQLAERAAEVFALDYTVVDLVEAKTDYLIYEVSAFGGFRGLWEASRYDVAADYARYVRCDLLC
jgi:ribosomal protein S6--L-glutamate ligase